MLGYKSKMHQVPIKRYCRTLNLKNDAQLIAEYKKRHSQKEAWPEIRAGIKEVGILEMEIYLLDNKLFMIIEVPLDFNWNEAMAKLATLPRQQEWEDYMSIFQQCKEGETAAEKWKMMERIFYLYE